MIRPDFDGDTYEPKLDGCRLHAQLQDVHLLMADQNWRTLREIASATDHPEASISARLRDLRKFRFGGFTVERRRSNQGGTFEYRLLPPPPATPEGQGELFA